MIGKHHDSAYFTRDHRVLKNATYGKPKAAELAEKKLREQFGEMYDGNVEQQRELEVNVSFQHQEQSIEQHGESDIIDVDLD